MHVGLAQAMQAQLLRDRWRMQSGRQPLQASKEGAEMSSRRSPRSGSLLVQAPALHSKLTRHVCCVLLDKWLCCWVAGKGAAPAAAARWC